MTNEKRRRLFGTDGVRGEANQWPMTPDVILKLAMATAPQFLRGDHRHTVVIGKDTRLSGYMVESALTAGFVAMGLDVVLLGPIPTPAVAMLTRSLRADLGVMISASHNPYKDNGIKFFGPSGFKLTNAQEDMIEATLNADTFVLPSAEHTAKARRLDDAGGRYIEYIKSTFPKNMRLDGLKIVVDCAHGAAYKVAPRILWELGAEVITIGANPDGHNINDGFGALRPQALQEAVVANKADMGIALDGDADRLILVDEKGAVLDGDELLAVIATSWKEEGRLQGDVVVATVMSNLGLERYLESQGMRLIRTPVGDRYVVETMRENGYNVGGEQSGHLILSDYNSTGDGLVAALQVIAVLLGRGKPTSYINTIFDRVPQVLKNVRVSRRTSLENKDVQTAITEAEQEISAVKGRLLVRASGTEPLIRVMAEGDDATVLGPIVDRLITSIQQADQKAA